MFAALMNMWLTTRFGFGIVSLVYFGQIKSNIDLSFALRKTITLGAALQVATYCIQAAKPPFPLFAFAYTVNGFGQALQDAQANGLVALLPTSPNSKMSILHAVYGLGAFASPLVATQFSAMDHKWSFHFLTSLGLALMTFAALVAVFRFQTQDGTYISTYCESVILNSFIFT